MMARAAVTLMSLVGGVRPRMPMRLERPMYRATVPSHGAKERVEVGKDGAEPPRERVGSEPVVDIGELPVACESGVSGHTPGKSTPRICVAMGKGFS